MFVQGAMRQARPLAEQIDRKLFRGEMGLCTGRTTIEELRDSFIVYQEKDTDNRYRRLRDLRGRTGKFVEWAEAKGIRLVSVVTLEVDEMFVRHLRHTTSIFTIEP